MYSEYSRSFDFGYTVVDYFVGISERSDYYYKSVHLFEEVDSLDFYFLNVELDLFEHIDWFVVQHCWKVYVPNLLLFHILYLGF